MNKFEEFSIGVFIAMISILAVTQLIDIIFFVIKRCT